MKWNESSTWRRWVAALFAVAVISFGCGDDTNDGPADGDNVATDIEGNLYIVNEGGFQLGQASLSYVNVETGDVAQMAFRTANNRSLGDTANDIYIDGDRAWVVVNISHTIEVIETGSHKSLETIQFTVGSAPFTITVDEAARVGYVTLLQANSIIRVDMDAMSIIGSPIEVGANPREVALANGKAYVSVSGFGSGSTVAVVDTATFAIAQIIEVGMNPTGIVTTSDGKVLVLASGSTYDDPNTPDDERAPGGLVMIDPATDTVTDSIPLDSGASDRMEKGDGNAVYFLMPGGVARFDTATMDLTSDYITAGEVGATGFYGLSADPMTGRVYVTDAKDFQTSGDVFVLEAAGTLVGQYQADIIPRAVGVIR